MHFFDVQRVAHVLASRAAGKRCLCVAIEDAGKSTLAWKLAAAAYATVVHGDDLYRVMDIEVHAALTPEEGYRRNFDWQRGESPKSLSAEDLTDWQTNFGMVPLLPATSSTVPKPTTGIMLLIGMTTVLTDG
jgi:hypothetical protein